MLCGIASSIERSNVFEVARIPATGYHIIVYCLTKIDALQVCEFRSLNIKLRSTFFFATIIT